ncbi:unnamed protein product, partial [Meganyctiphanes norvegica]
MVTVVLRDISKAFDKIWHSGLIFKLLQLGLNVNLMRTLANFLSNRKANIKVNNTKGTIFNLHAGVPQGDVHSPTLFLIMCNDYPDPTFTRTIRNFCKQYADNFTQVIVNKFTGHINDRRREIHRQNVQDEINRQNNYENKWKLKTNIEKFCIILMGFRKTSPIQIGNQMKEYQNEGKILGLTFTRNNFMVKHIKKTIEKANMVQKQLYRFQLLNKNLKLRLYKTLILPIILYPVIPIHACSNSQLKKLQIVQNNAVRWICNDRYPNRQPLDIH